MKIKSLFLTYFLFITTLESNESINKGRISPLTEETDSEELRDSLAEAVNNSFLIQEEKSINREERIASSWHGTIQRFLVGAGQIKNVRPWNKKHPKISKLANLLTKNDIDKMVEISRFTVLSEKDFLEQSSKTFQIFFYALESVGINTIVFSWTTKFSPEQELCAQQLLTRGQMLEKQIDEFLDEMIARDEKAPSIDKKLEIARSGDPHDISEYELLNLIQKIKFGNAKVKENMKVAEYLGCLHEKILKKMQKINVKSVEYISQYMSLEIDVDTLRRKTRAVIFKCLESLNLSLQRIEGLSEILPYKETIDKIKKIQRELKSAHGATASFLAIIFKKKVAPQLNSEVVKNNFLAAYSKHKHSKESNSLFQSTKKELFKATIILRIMLDPDKTISEKSASQEAKLLKHAETLYTALKN